MSAPLSVEGGRDALLCAQYFAKHHAEYSRAELGRATVERLIWREPGTSINRVDYLCDGGRLFVAGDLGDAIYITGAHDLAWWTRCDLSYFASKCDASEYGRGYKTWDDAECRARVNGQVEQMRADGETVDADRVYAALYAIGDGRDAWTEWMRGEASDLFGDDWWDFVPNFGVRPDQRCALHLAGLKAAMTQLRATEHPDAAAFDFSRSIPTAVAGSTYTAPLAGPTP